MYRKSQLLKVTSLLNVLSMINFERFACDWFMSHDNLVSDRITLSICVGIHTTVSRLDTCHNSHTILNIFVIYVLIESQGNVFSIAREFAH